MIARCSTCFREEIHDGDTVEVRQPGGSRQPTGHPVVAAWKALTADARIPVGVCVCGQPLLGEGPMVPYVLTLPDGQLTYAEGPSDHNGPIPPEAAEALLLAAYPDRWFQDVSVGRTAFGTIAMLSMLAPVALWVGAALTVIMVLFGLTSQPGFG